MSPPLLSEPVREILARLGKRDAELLLGVMSEAYEAGRTDALSTIPTAVAAALAVNRAVITPPDRPAVRGLGQRGPEPEHGLAPAVEEWAARPTRGGKPDHWT